jgi:hypothetical protein
VSYDPRSPFGEVDPDGDDQDSEQSSDDGGGFGAEEGGAAPRPDANLEGDDSSDTSPPSADDRADTISDAGGDSSDSSSDSSSDVDPTTPTTRRASPSVDERGDTIRDAGDSSSSQSRGATSQDSSQDSSQTSQSGGDSGFSTTEEGGAAPEQGDAVITDQDTLSTTEEGGAAPEPTTGGPDIVDDTEQQTPTGLDPFEDTERKGGATSADFDQGDETEGPPPVGRTTVGEDATDSEIQREVEQGADRLGGSPSDFEAYRVGDELVFYDEDTENIDEGLTRVQAGQIEEDLQGQGYDADDVAVSQTDSGEFEIAVDPTVRRQEGAAQLSDELGRDISPGEVVFEESASGETRVTVSDEAIEERRTDQAFDAAVENLQRTEDARQDAVFDTAVNELTQEGREQIQEGDPGEDLSREEAYAAGADVLAGSTDEAVGRAVDAARERDAAGVADALAGSTDEAVGRAADAFAEGDTAAAADNLGGGVGDEARAFWRGVSTLEEAAAERRPDSVDEDAATVEERLGTTDEAQAEAGAALLEGEFTRAADAAFGNVDEQVAAAAIDEETTNQLTQGGFLTEAQEQDLRIASDQFSEDADAVADAVGEGIRPSLTLQAAEAQEDTRSEIPVGDTGLDIDVDAINEQGEDFRERAAQAGVRNVAQIGNVFGAAAGAETAAETAENIPDAFAEGRAPAAIGSGAAVGRQAGSRAVTSAASDPFAAGGAAVGGLGAGWVAGTATASALRATRLTRVPGVSASDMTGRAVTGRSDGRPNTPGAAGDDLPTTGQSVDGGLTQRVREIRDRSPDVRVTTDPDSPRLDVDPALKTQLRDRLSRENIEQTLADPDTGRLPINSGERQLLDVFEDDTDALVGPIQGRVQGAALRTELGARRVADRVRGGIGPTNRADRQLLDVFEDDETPMVGPIQGRLQGAAIQGEIAARRLGQRFREGIGPSNRADRQLLDVFEDDDTDALVGPIQGRVQGAALRTELGARRVADRVRDQDAPFNEADRQQLDVFQESDEQLTGPVEGVFQGGLLAGESVARGGRAAIRGVGDRVEGAAESAADTIQSARNAGVAISPIRPRRTARVVDDETDLGPFMDDDEAPFAGEEIDTGSTDSTATGTRGVDTGDGERQLTRVGVARDRDTRGRADLDDATRRDSDTGVGAGAFGAFGAGAASLSPGAGALDRDAATSASVGEGVGEGFGEAQGLGGAFREDFETGVGTGAGTATGTATGGDIVQGGDTTLRLDSRQDQGAGRQDFRSDFGFRREEPPERDPMPDLGFDATGDTFDTGVAQSLEDLDERGEETADLFGELGVDDDRGLDDPFDDDRDDPFDNLGF